MPTHVWKWDHQTHFLALSGWLPQVDLGLYTFDLMYPTLEQYYGLAWLQTVTCWPPPLNMHTVRPTTCLRICTRFWIWLDVWLIGWTPPPTKALNVGLWDACCTSGCAPIWELYLLNINQSINQTIIQWKHVPEIGGCSYNNEKQQYICITYI